MQAMDCCSRARRARSGVSDAGYNQATDRLLAGDQAEKKRQESWHGSNLIKCPGACSSPFTGAATSRLLSERDRDPPQAHKGLFASGELRLHSEKIALRTTRPTSQTAELTAPPRAAISGRLCPTLPRPPPFPWTTSSRSRSAAGLCFRRRKSTAGSTASSTTARSVRS